MHLAVLQTKDRLSNRTPPFRLARLTIDKRKPKLKACWTTTCFHSLRETSLTEFRPVFPWTDMSHNLFNELQSFPPTAGTTEQYYALPQLEKEGIGPISRLPVSIRIVLESV